MQKKPNPLHRPVLVPERVRSIGNEGFAFVPNRFLLGGFFAALEPSELLLYFFLVLAGNRKGISFYHYDSICSLLQMSLEQYLKARNSLIKKDLIAFDGTRFQVLELPPEPTSVKTLFDFTNQEESKDPASMYALIQQSLREKAE